jgi:[1-hydroxy-2-(trimethylamino)ethyl]phosphonate dioxygenase
MTPIDTIFEYLRAGQKHYGESAVTQLEHAIQCAVLAERESAGSALVAASLLHDLGHLINPEDRMAAARGEDGGHEIVAADYLAHWFEDAMTMPIRLHVAAKRYLTATEPDYAAILSRASVRSLAAQGGPFSADAAREFAALPGAADAIRLRRWDERAKEKGATIPALEHFRGCLAASLKPGAGSMSVAGLL